MLFFALMPADAIFDDAVPPLSFSYVYCRLRLLLMRDAVIMPVLIRHSFTPYAAAATLRHCRLSAMPLLMSLRAGDAMP